MLKGRELALQPKRFCLQHGTASSQQNGASYSTEQPAASKTYMMRQTMTQDITIVSKTHTNEQPARPSGFLAYICAPWSDIRFITCVSLLFFVLLWCVHTWYGLAICVALAFLYAHTSKIFTRQTAIFFLPFVWFTVLSLSLIHI